MRGWDGVRQVLNFLVTILPGFVGVLSFFSTTWSNTIKFILALSFSTVYFLGLVIFLHIRLNKVQKQYASKETDLDQLKDDKQDSDEKIARYADFVHKRKLFIQHDLPEVGQLITEYEGHVKNSLRGQKYQEVRGVASSVKSRTNEIINKEKRDFDEQFYNIQGD